MSTAHRPSVRRVKNLKLNIGAEKQQYSLCASHQGRELHKYKFGYGNLLWIRIIATLLIK